MGHRRQSYYHIEGVDSKRSIAVVGVEDDGADFDDSVILVSFAGVGVCNALIL
jgi:hypothetical protein